jgi:hypothetical protein
MALTKATNRMISGANANVLDFGAVGDGVTDDTVAIQAAIDSGSKNVFFPEGSFKITSTITISTIISISGNGINGGSEIHSYGSNDKMFNFTNSFTLSSLSFKSKGDTDQFIFADSLAEGCIIKDCKFDWADGTGANGSNGWGVSLANSSHVHIYRNTFKNGWRDTTYHAGNVGPETGENLKRVLTVQNTDSDSDVTFENNTLDDIYTGCYFGNCNNLRVSNNNVLTSADTVFFDRATVGYTTNKTYSNNIIKNAGKGAIKCLDTNNNTAGVGGANASIVGNVIENFGMKIGTAAIFVAGGYDGGYAYDSNTRNSSISISGNSILETDASSCHEPLALTNIDDAVISNNSFYMLGSSTDVWDFAAWSRFTMTGNNITVAGRIYIGNSVLKAVITGNNFNCYDYIELNNTNSASPEPNRMVFTFSNNHVKTIDSDATRPTYGIKFSNNTGGYGSLNITGNTFETNLAFSDSNATGTPHILNIPTGGNIIDYTLVDNNAVIFTDKVASQKLLGGDILYPIYYSGYKGSATIDESTGVVTYKKDENRTSVNTITPTT